MSDGSGQTETTFDEAGRPSTVSSGPTTYATVQQYAAQGGIGQVTFGNQVVETESYDGHLQPISIAAAKSGVQVLSLQYLNGKSGGCNGGLSICRNGNVYQQTITDGPPGSWTATQSYTYDGLNRLQSAIETGNANEWGQQYGHDQYGNHWVDTSSSNTSGFGIPTSILTPLGNATSSSYFDGSNHLVSPYATYDTSGSGNEIGLVSGISMQYDGENRQTKVTLANGTQELYSYDGEGRRVQHREVANNTVINSTIYAYDALGRLAGEYGDPRAIAPCATCYLTQDHLGSTRMMTDGTTGAAVARYDYLPFGEEIPSTSGNRSSVLCNCYNQTVAVTQKFTGKERDLETALDYFIARYMSSAQARFTSPDDPLADQFPSDPQSWNLYSYGRNNPLTNSDPSGRDCVTTSNQTDTSVTASVASGSCNGNMGAYVPGTIDTKSLTYNGKSVGYSYTPYDSNSLSGSGTIGLTSAPSDQMSAFGTGVLSQLDRNANPSMALIGVVAGVSAAVGATGGAVCSFFCSSAIAAPLGITIGGTLGPAATNPRLQNFIGELFQITDKLPGGTAGAVRYELSTGDTVGGVSHLQKAQESITYLTRLLKSGELSYHDQQVARELIRDLTNALGRK